MTAGATLSPPGEGNFASAQRPRISVGLPVYNGQNFLAAAIESVLAQTYRDFALVISDNASTDATQRICEEFASRDPRVDYHRAKTNRGIVWNFNEVFRLSRTEYFMWFAHDDALAPQYLERCLAVLDRDPSVVSCFSSCRDIDGTGATIGVRHSRVVMDSADRVTRFREGIRLDHLCEPWCGLTRSEVLRRTALLGAFADYDRVIIAELGLHGRLVEIPEPLFINREHADRSHQVYASRAERTRWLDARNARGLVFPHFRQLREFWESVRRARIPLSQQARCAWALAKWSGSNRKRLTADLDVAGRELIRNVLTRAGLRG